MEIRIPFYSVLTKLIRKFSPSNVVAFFAIVVLSLFHSELKAQITSVTSDNNPSCFGSAINFSAAVAGATAGNTVDFYDGIAIPANLLASVPVNLAGNTIY